MSELSSLPNVGKVLEKLLNDSGITTASALREIGTEEAFIRIRTQDPGACLHMLYGLQGAIDNVRDTELEEPTKARLRTFFKSL